ncbi:MAG: FHA domain-containing protein [Candidatus Promineifilaceae bacterium]
MMSEAALLLLLRLASGLLLFVFLAVLASFVYRDLQQSAEEVRASRQAYGTLRVVSSDASSAAEGTVFPLLPITRIGRAAGNTIVLEDSFVSSEHAMLTRRERQWWLEDLQSRNGTILNDLRVEAPTVVGAGDIITIGSVQLRIEPPAVAG